MNVHNPYEAKPFTWALRTLNPKNEKDKKSIAHASAGFAYYIIQSPELGRQYYVVGFKYFGGPLSVDVSKATPQQSRDLDRLDALRYGLSVK